MLILGAMRFLRVLINSLLAGLFFAFLLAVLVADLNINRPFDLGFLARLTLNLAPVYGLLLAVVCALGFVFAQFFSGRGGRIALVSPSLLSLSFSLLILLFLGIFRTNERYFSSFFSPEIKARLVNQSVFLLTIALMGLFCFFGYRRSRKARFFWAYFILLVFGLALVFIQRARFPLVREPSGKTPLLGKKTEKRITLIGLDGLSFDLLIPFLSLGKLPNFSWLMDNGNSGRLVSFSPSEPLSLQTSFTTGKLPAKHRLLSERRFRLWKMREELETAPRFILFSQLTRFGFLEITPFRPEIRIKDFWRILEGNRISYLDRSRPQSANGQAPSSKVEKQAASLLGESVLPGDSLSTLARSAFLRDSTAEESASAEREERQPQIFHLRLDGLKSVQAYFYKYSFPEQFGDIALDDIERYGPVIERYYEYYDKLLGKFLTGLKEDEILVVYSPFGVEPLPLWKRFVERLLGDPGISAYHELAPAGVVFLYGKGVRKGRHDEPFRIVDITPTLLYYLGLPVGRDMDGIVRSSAFADDFIAENPIIYISSYEEFEIQPPL
jgi:Type I phosphodiesterase / nucleotide pyrophosphatase